MLLKLTGLMVGNATGKHDLFWGLVFSLSHLGFSAELPLNQFGEIRNRVNQTNPKHSFAKQPYCNVLSIRWCNLRASALPKPKRLRKAAEVTCDADDAWQSVVLGWQLHDRLDDIGFMLGCSLSQYHQLDAHSCENGLYRFHMFSPCHVQIPRGRQSCRTQVLLSEHLAERTKSREQAAQYLGFGVRCST